MTLQRCILTLDSKEKSERTSDWVDVAHTETSDVELVRMIERRSRKGEAHPEELEPSYMESVRRHNDRRREEMRTAWASYHEGQAASHRATLRALVEHHEHEAAKLMDVQTERSLG